MDTKPLVFTSIEDGEHNRCVDLFSRPDGSFDFEEYRRDVEDLGSWTRVGSFHSGAYGSAQEALRSAIGCVAWLEHALEKSPEGLAILATQPTSRLTSADDPPHNENDRL